MLMSGLSLDAKKNLVMCRIDRRCSSEEVSKAHKEMLIYQHDLEKNSIGEHNCLNIDFEKLFTEGFATRNGDIRPPSSFSTACQQR